MKEDQVEYYSENLKQNVTHDRFYGTVTSEDKVKYSSKEVEAIIQQKVLTGSDVTMNQHLVKKVFGGEIQAYRGNRKVGNGNPGRDSKSPHPVRVDGVSPKFGAQRWDSVAPERDTGSISDAQESFGFY